MKEFDIFAILFIAFGIYCAFGLKKEYAEYKKTKHYLEFGIFIKSLGVVIGSIVMFFYELSRIFSQF